MPNLQKLLRVRYITCVRIVLFLFAVLLLIARSRIIVGSPQLVEIKTTELWRAIDDDLPVETIRAIARKKPAEIDRPVEYLGTPLNLAADARKLEIVDCLLSEGANVDQIDQYGYTILHTAALRDDVELARIALRYDADILIKNKNEETALELAKEYESKEVEKLLETRQ